MSIIIQSRWTTDAAPRGEVVDSHLQAVLDAAIDAMMSPASAEAIERLRRSKAYQAQNNVPKDLEPEADDTTAPTPERVAGRGDFDAGDARRAWFAVPTVERMHRRGQIGDAELGAAKQFYRDFHMGMRQGGLTARYGEQAGGSTPAGQRSTLYNRDGTEALSPDERRTGSHTAWIMACRAVGMLRDPATNAETPSAVVFWLQKIVAEDYQLQNERAPTLADVGHQYLGVKSKEQAQAVGAAVIKFALERLAAHYGL